MQALDRIKATLAAHPVVLFMKGVPDYPMCDSSARALAALKHAGMPFHAVNLLADPQLRAALPRYAHVPTFPQLFIHGEILGGCEVIEDLHAAGELSRIAADVSRVSA